MKIAEQIKMINANTKVDALNSNVMELETIMKGNVNKIVSNMSDLETMSKLPDEVGQLSSLRSLNISTNKIHKLPVALCHVTVLESLTLDVDKMRYPDTRTCEGGIEAIMRRLCAGQ